MFQRFALMPGSSLIHSFTSSTEVELKIKIPPPPSNGPATISFPSLAILLMLAMWPSIILSVSSFGSSALSTFLLRKTNVNLLDCAKQDE